MTRTTFIVRITASDCDAPTGVVERVRTGEKHKFRGLDAISEVIASMLANARDVRDGTSGAGEDA